MDRTRGWTGLLSSVVALGLMAGGARADALLSNDVAPNTVDVPTLLAYSTVGSTIGTDGVSGATGSTPAITFVPVSGSALTPSTLSLGSFQASALGDGQSVTYNNTPFDIKFTATSVNGAGDFLPNGTPIDVKGVLNGTLTGADQSGVTATFGPAGTSGAFAYPTFVTGLYTNLLKIPDNPISVAPSTTNSGLTSAQAYVASALTPNSPVPEPSTVVLFAATIAGLGFRHRIRRARAAG
jgi:hypothetical protein